MQQLSARAGRVVHLRRAQPACSSPEQSWSKCLKQRTGGTLANRDGSQHRCCALPQRTIEFDRSLDAEQSSLPAR
ncbi:hypothetical protein ASPCADRAFT_202571 [Aspergillus carbonarius ITEM 5010]|uniref:Uncharacterized protein n=1 Tax=Aspergillus carbonarius (strain ITEM 5010) TaxID=602072 RepID=A0A1R3S1Y1_ASPC5|nr:hypothetical protein ASPCADRAFT_202571 [Aspergillus carbonarius ITEM 5010]